MKKKIAVIIPSKNNLESLKRTINSINDHCKNYEEDYHIFVIDTGYDNPLKSEDFRNVTVERVIRNEFNFAWTNNYAVKNFTKKFEVLCFCNDDIEFLSNNFDYVNQVYNTVDEDQIGTIGGKLIIPNNSSEKTFHINHLGIFVHHNYITKQWNVNHITSISPNNPSGFRFVFGNTGALLFIKRDLFIDYGFSDIFRECYEDVALNFDTLFLNKININYDKILAVHYESTTRNKNQDKLKRMDEDLKHLNEYFNHRKTRFLELNKKMNFQNMRMGMNDFYFHNYADQNNYNPYLEKLHG